MNVKVLNIRLVKEHFEKDQEKVNQFLESVKMRKSSSHLVEDKINYWSILFYYTEKDNQEEEKVEIDESLMDPMQKEIYRALKEWRNSVASEKNIPAFTVLHNQTLIDIVYEKVKNIEELDKIKGIGQTKLARYGNDIIAVLNAF